MSARESERAALVKGLRTVELGLEYYAITLTADSELRISRAIQTHFVGFASERPRREIRAGSLVEPNRMIDLWTSIGQGYVIVSSLAHLAVFIRFGGNALVERRIAERHFADLTGPNEVGHSGPFGGQIVRRNLQLPELNRAPRRAQRMRVIRRDQYRCTICGRRPTDDVDLQLDVHHIASWGKGGLTVDSNLITVCDTCHDGLDDLHRIDIFALLDPKLGLGYGPSDYLRGVERYRTKIKALEAAYEASREGKATDKTRR